MRGLRTSDFVCNAYCPHVTAQIEFVGRGGTYLGEQIMAMRQNMYAYVFTHTHTHTLKFAKAYFPECDSRPFKEQ